MTEGLHEHIDIYCERLDASYWAEPINAITNIAFLIAALAAYLLHRKQPQSSFVSLLLIINVFLIGIGSYLFHTHATRWSLLADVIPITIFMHLYLFLFVRNILNAGTSMGIISVFIFIGASYLISPVLLPADALNGSVMYFSSVLALLVCSGLLYYQNHPDRVLLITGTLVFIASITMRSLDMAACDYLPIGIHYFWHIFNATLLYLLLRLYILHRKPA